MDVGELKCSPTEDEEEGHSMVVGHLAAVRLVDAPILLLVCFHKATRAELVELRRLAVEALEARSHSRELILDLHRRFDFLKLVYKYHCAAEDEVIFDALDGCVKNIAHTYSLEHESIDGLFDKISHCLNILMKEEENISEAFQELIFCIGTAQTIICQHMAKEEEQVFPLLIKKFSPKEQASLVWRFMCSVPMMLLEDFLPWMAFFLSTDEQVDVLHSIKEILPKETLLQEVVISWFANKKQSFGDNNKYEKGAQFHGRQFNLKDMLSLYISKSHSGEEMQLKKVYPIGASSTGPDNFIDGIHIWHRAIRRGLKGIFEELYQMKSSGSFSTLASVTVQLIFFVDVLIFYSNALDKIFCDLKSELAQIFLTPSYKRFPDESQIEDLQKLLYDKVQSGASLRNFVNKIYDVVKLFVRDMGKHLIFLESEVFPLIGKNCSSEFQKWLLYTSLRMIPFGLLKCTITWFSTQLSEDEYKSIQRGIERGCPAIDDSFESLLHEWLRIGYSGKTSVRKFRKDLKEMFNGRSTFLSQQIQDESEFPFIEHNITSSKRSDPLQLERNPSIMTKKGLPYVMGVNLHILFPQTLKNPKFPAEPSSAGAFSNLESRPIDFIFLFHKALKKDLEYLVCISANVAEKVEFLQDFRLRFQKMRLLYQIHTDSEDEVTFPALELKGKLQNISQSYTIDHKLEVEHFNKILRILYEISELHISSSIDNMETINLGRLRYQQACVKLQDICKSMHKMICDHVYREESELWPLFRDCFSIEEQEKIVGRVLGRTRAETLQEMIPWLMASLTPDEQHGVMSIWRKVCKNTMFVEWLGEWWEGMKSYEIAKVEEEPNAPSWDPLEIVSKYLLKDGFRNVGSRTSGFQQNNLSISNLEPFGILSVDKARVSTEEPYDRQSSDATNFFSEGDKKSRNEMTRMTDEDDKPGPDVKVSLKFSHLEHPLLMSQEELEAVIRRVSRDSTLDPRKKSCIMQNLIMSRWMFMQPKPCPDVAVSIDEKEISVRSPSYRDASNSSFGCKHYKRNCKLVADCCNKLYTCIRCHDDLAGHSLKRKSITKMMCMVCLVIQIIGPTCSTSSCNNLSMAKYYCGICKLYDDEREIYHCPYCNLCRVGKGLGIDYFHCMNCNACMSRSLVEHICREKCFEDNCPICHEYIFTSRSPIKALPCGHLMHSACFQDYTDTHYTCPICSKSLGDMQVYFGMLDALLAEEIIPDEYAGQTQAILCNDCEKKGTASFHWLYHKCSYCGSYNTRLL